jgi:hypothetical protein
MATRGPDLLDHAFRGLAIAPFADQRAAKVVDDDARAFRREAVRLGPTDATPTAGDNRHSAVECSHAVAENSLVPMNHGREAIR